MSIFRRVIMMWLCSIGGVPITAAAVAPYMPRYDHVVVVIMSNKSYSDVVGSVNAPFINDTLIAQGASFTSSYAVADIAQPNYWAIFSGSTQITEFATSCPNSFPGSNLGRQLIDASFSFAQYSEGLGLLGNTTCGSGLYTRAHNPVPDFTDLPAATSTNRDYSDFSTMISNGTLPTISFVVPQLCHDMHADFTTCNLGIGGMVALGDTWLQNNLPLYLAFAAANNGLLIITWDECGGTAATTRIPTIFVGPHVKAGSVSATTISHYNILRTLEDMYGLASLGSAAAADPITDIWDDTLFRNGFELSP